MAKESKDRTAVNWAAPLQSVLTLTVSVAAPSSELTVPAGAAVNVSV